MTEAPTAEAKPDLAAIASQLAAITPILESIPELKGRMTEFGRDLARVRKERKSESGDGGTQVPAAPLTQEDLRAAMRLGQVTASFSESAAKYIDDMQANGASYADALRVAEGMRLMSQSAAQPVTGAPVPGGVTPPATLTGVAATAASRTAPSHPRSLSEYAALAKSDPERFRALKADPTFDPAILPHVTR